MTDTPNIDDADKQLIPANHNPNLEVDLAAIPVITEQSSYKDVKKADMIVANNVLQALHLGWGQATTIGQICNLAKTTMSTIAERRKLLVMPYGNQSNSTSGNAFVDLD